MKLDDENWHCFTLSQVRPSQRKVNAREGAGLPPHRLRPATVRWLAVLVAIAAGPGTAEEISEGRYAKPVERYGHFALGRPHEYARLVARTDRGRDLAFELPQDEVFEDLEPRLVRLAPTEPPLLLAIVSARSSGARLALLGLAGDRLATLAQSQAIGTPNRWLNPVGVADLDGDGRAEVAAVITPHIGGTLKIYRRNGARLEEIAALPGFSNHVYGSAELSLSMPLAVRGRMRLVVPDAARSSLRVIALEGDRLRETGRCALASPLAGPVRPAAIDVCRLR